MMEIPVRAIADSEEAVLLQTMNLHDDAQRRLVSATRDLIKELFPGVQEASRYGGIQFSLGQAFCGIYAYSRHISVELSHGAKIPGPLELEGKGQYRRHIKLHSLEDISNKRLAYYLPLALQAALGAA